MIRERPAFVTLLIRKLKKQQSYAAVLDWFVIMTDKDRDQILH